VRTAGLVLLLAVVLLGPSMVSGVPSGLGDEANEGCLCHASTAAATVELDGLPEAYIANTTYDLVLTVTSTIEVNIDGYLGGFRIQASNGTFSYDTSMLQFLDGGLTHREAGAGQRVWTFNWTAPPVNDSRTDFVIHANAVNGNNAPSEDAWTTVRLVVPSVGFTGDLTPSEGIDGVSGTDRMVLAVGLLVLAGLLWTNLRP